MRTSVRRLAAASLCLAVCAVSAWAKPNNPPVPGWYGLGREDVFLIYALASNPKLHAELNVDKSAVDQMAAGPAKDAAAARFRAKWMGEIASFSRSYSPGQNVPGTKPSIAEARAKIPWLDKLDQDGWHGQIFEELDRRLDAPEMNLIVARMQSLDNAPQDKTRVQMESKLGPGSLARMFASAATVAEAMIYNEKNPGDIDTIRGYMAQLQREALERSQQVIAQADQEASAAEAKAGPAPASKVTDAKTQAERLAQQPSSAAGTFDGAKTNPAASVAGPVPASPQPGVPDSAHRQLSPAAPQQPAVADALAGPPPPAPEANSEPGLKVRPSATDMATSTPMLLGLAGGALLGAGLGLLLGGPIGALIGAGLGLLLGAAGGFGFLMR